MVRFVLALLVSFTSFASGAAEFEHLEARKIPITSCSTGPNNRSTTLLQNEDHIIVAAWNVENVMDDGSATKDWKFVAKQEKIARIGEELGSKQLADFIISPEVENLHIANQLFNTGVLANKYRTVLIEGNDERGIDVAFAIRADLDVTLEAETHKDAVWNDPRQHQQIRLFSRDLPVVIVKDRASQKVMMLLVGNHAKSKRDRGQDHESNQLRTAQYEAAQMIIESYQKEYPRTPIFFAGDFNTDVRNGPEVAPIRSFLKDSFDIAKVEDRTTETYYPPEGGMVESQLDAVFMNSESTRYVLAAEVLPEFDHVSGKPLPQAPKSFKDRQDNYPSDHRAIAVVLDGAILAH